MITNDFIFIHIPKTGGSSIERFFGQDHGLPGTPPAHKNIQWYLNHKQSNNRLYKFSFVRNPWDMFVSLYFFKVHSKYRKEELEGVTFFEYIKQYDHKTQLSYLTVNGKIMVDFIGRFERLQEDFYKVCDALNIPRSDLPHIIKTTHLPYREYYNTQARKIIEEIYKEDIDYFGYEF